MTHKYSYPDTRVDDTVDAYHGVEIADKFRWLENIESDEVKSWLQEQRFLTESCLRNISKIDRIKAHLNHWAERDSIQLSFSGGLRVENNYVFFQKLNAGQNQPVLYRQNLSDNHSEPEPVLDPNRWSEDAATAMIGYFPDRSGRLLAYNVSEGGSDWHSIRIRDLDTGEDLPDIIRWCKSYANIWRFDSSGFYYYGSGHLDEAPPDPLIRQKVFYHRLGTEQSQDQIIFESDDPMVLMVWMHHSSDWKNLVLTVFYGTLNKMRVYIKSLNDDSEFKSLDINADSALWFIGNVEERYYFVTDWNAENGRIVALEYSDPGREHWQEIVPEKDPIPMGLGFGNNTCLSKEYIIVQYLNNAAHQLVAYDLDGKQKFGLDLPVSSISSVCPIPGENSLLVALENFLLSTAIYRVDLENNQRSIWLKTSNNLNPKDYDVKQVTYPSKDGTEVQMWLVQRKDVEYDGKNAVFLSAYGGFGLTMTPSFALGGFGPPVAAWLEMGGIYAFAHIRGGGEHGEAWHEAGKLDRKQNVFDDFIAAAEWLLENGVTQKERLTIYGLSNGGLLTATCLTQRPDLFGTVIVDVPLTDMLRYHRFTVGRYWVGEYGSADASPQQFETLLAYSPYHNVKPGTVYPPTMIITSEFDNTTVPAHAMKFAAALQAADAGENPILLRYEFRAGHGGGKPTYKLVEEFTDIFAFIRHTQGW